MTTFNLTGFQVTRDPSDTVVAIDPVTLSVFVPAGQTTFSYTILATPADEIPEVDIAADDVATLASGPGVPGGTASVPEDADTFLGTVTTASSSHVVFTVELEQDDGSLIEGIFQIGGDPLTPPTTVADFNSLEASITGFGQAIAALAPGATIDFGSLANTTSDPGPNFVVGTDGDDFLEGTAGDDLIITGDATPNGDFVVGSAGDDTIDMSGMNPSTAFMTMGYGDLGSAISVDMDGAANTATVDKGALGTDTLIDIANPLDAGFNLGGFGVIGTAQGDTFDLDPGAGQWMQVRGGDGAESYVIGDTGFVRLDFVFVEAPQGAEIDLGLATDQIINDGFGNTETITGPGTVWEIRGTENDDLITGSAADESFISREGDDTIDGGGGFDRLRYDRSGVDGITADLAAGQVTGTWNGIAFTDTISNIEQLRGSNGNDVIGGNTTDNLLGGRGGTDAFVHLGGNDTISDFDAATETLIVRVAGLDQTQVDDAIDNANDQGGNALVNFGAGSLLFSGVSTAALAGANVQFVEPGTANIVLGTDGNDTLEGTSGDDLVITFDTDSTGDLYIASAGDDTIDMSGMNQTDAWFVMDYGGIAAPIDVQIDGGNNTGTIGKGADGTDTLIDVENPLFSGWTLGGLSIVGTSGDDTFDLAIEGQQWMSFRPGDGTDTITVGGDPSLIRLDMSDGNGINVNLSLGSNQILDDGFGNTETIGGTAPIWEVFGSQGNDTFVGSDNAESYRYRGGDNDLDGGAGFDRLRYDGFNVASVTIDATAGTATGTLTDGGTFTDTISGFERLRGSNGDDQISGEASVANRYEGRGGTDTFVHLGGSDMISDFDAATETLIVRVAGLDQAQVDTAISGATDQGGSALVDFGASSVLFSGVSTAALAGANVQFVEPGTANIVQGTDGNDTLVGTSGDDLVITGDTDFNGDFYEASTGDDTIDMSGMNQTDAWFVMEYGVLGGPIDVQIDGGANTGTIGKGADGTDTLVDVENPLFSGWISGGLSIHGTAADDTFNVSPAGPQWMSIRPGDGIDTIIVGGSGTERTDPGDEIGAVRLQMSDGFGIDVNLATRMIADDGFGNAETIGGTAPVWEVFGSAGNDAFTGSDNAESFRANGGNDTLDGGAGFDRLRYDSFPITSVDIDAGAGTATGTLNGGGTFTDTISGFEHLRGSNGNDRISGETGVDNRYEGRGGTDTFVHLGGNDTISDFNAQTETLVVRVAGLDQAQVDTAIAGATDQGNDALVSFGAGSVLFSGVTAADLAGADVQLLEPGAATPPPPPSGPAAWTIGDPHLLTLDGLGYDFHAVGEYVLLRGQTGEDVGGFEIQSRMTPATDDQGADLDNVSVNAAIAMRAANGDAVMIDSNDAVPLSVGGTAVNLADGDVHDVGVDRVFRSGDTYTMVFAGADGILNDGDTQVAVVVHDARVDLSVRISEALAGRVEGLLGDGDGNIGNDIARADGTVLARPLAFEDLYGGYRDDWRVDAEGDSLFTYDAGESLAVFYDATKPGAVTTLDDFDAGALSAAQQAVAASGLTPGTLNYDNAVLDFLLTDDQSFIDSAASEDVAAPDTASAAPTLDVGQGRAMLNITVNDRAGDGIEGASVGFSAGASTARSLAEDAGGGAYALSVGDGASGRVDGTLDATNTDEITAGDALEVLRIAVGLDPSWGPAQGLDFVAADLNDDSRVTAGDALEVLRAAVGLDSEHAPRWKFVDPDQDVSGASANDVPDLGGVDIAAINVTQNVEMTAVLLGNMENFA